MSDMPYRTLGHTGERVSAIGVGGWHLSLSHVDEALAVRIVRTAIDRGINFLDNSWDYEKGRSELVDARQAGKLRYIGFTGHKDPRIHLYMLEVAAAHGFTFDAVQMPLNALDAHYRSFGKLVLPLLVESGIAVLGMKSMGDGNLLRSGAVSAVECLHYALDLPTSVVITGIDSLEILDQALEAARTFRPLSDEARAALLARTADVAAEGEFEPFKTTSLFDGTAEHPEWLGVE